ncbi:MAG: serine/threonine protein kinase, partial [Myxococcales bacterium]|nr:serine/threonine protein kinase [Myxococcales bacterium]
DHWHDFDRPLAPAQAVNLMHQGCRVLAEVHARGIVHRDLKPENLWVEPHLNIKVIDFGLARGWDATSTVGMGVTRQGMLVGTPRYIQPEQVIGGVLTPRSDVYSLATILYELLTGHCVYFPDEPFSQVRERYRQEPAAWIGAHLQRKVVLLDCYPTTASLPPALHQLVYRGLSKDPQERFADARALANAVGEVLHYDLGAVPAAIVRVTLPWGGYEDRLLLPGVHRIGRAARCEIVLAEGGLEPEQAVLDW